MILMHATATQADRCFYVEQRPGPPREHWIVIWHRGDEDRLTRALDSWAGNPQLTFTSRDACRARQKVQADEWGLCSTYPPDRSCRWFEWVSVASVVAMILAVVVRWVW